MRSATAYFAGAGTVIAAITAGLGGGLLISNIVSPQQPKQGSSEVTRLERRMSPGADPRQREAGAGALSRRIADFGGHRRNAGPAAATQAIAAASRACANSGASS
jgi:hypothetical protein